MLESWLVQTNDLTLKLETHGQWQIQSSEMKAFKKKKKKVKEEGAGEKTHLLDTGQVQCQDFNDTITLYS